MNRMLDNASFGFGSVKEVEIRTLRLGAQILVSAAALDENGMRPV
jgi:hypothetical protein